MVDFVVDFVVGAFSVKWQKSLKFHKKSKVDVVAVKKKPPQRKFGGSFVEGGWIGEGRPMTGIIKIGFPSLSRVVERRETGFIFL